MMTAPDRRLSFGIKTSQMGLSYEEIQRIWLEADQIPVLEHAWLWDHMVPLRGEIIGAALEAWTLLAALGAQTSRLRLGVIVTSNRLRSPALLAKMAATVDIVAGGRLDFGIGAGGSQVAGPNPAVRTTCCSQFTAGKCVQIPFPFGRRTWPWITCSHVPLTRSHCLRDRSEATKTGSRSNFRP